MPADVTPFLLMGGGAVLILVGYSWLHDELHDPDKGWGLVSDLLLYGYPMAFLAIMLVGAFLLYLGWSSLA